jgi:4-amino-4-deoxy-L-arabinose transferase-like glycosyltransferase
VRRFAIALGVVVAAAVVVRIVYVLLQLRNDPLSADPLYYSLQGHDLAHGRWFIEPFRFRIDHVTEPSAFHPPLFSLYLGMVSRLGADSVLAHRIAACLLGAAAAGVMGLVGRRLAGNRAGLFAAAIAALFPYFWLNDAVVLSESLLALVTALMLLAAYAFWRDPSASRAALLGGGIALVALVRVEGVLLFALLALPLAFMVPGLDRRHRLERVGVIALAQLVLIGPWVGFNLARFQEPVYVSSGAGVALAGANCGDVYSGPFIGWWSFACLPERISNDEGVNDRKNREVAVRYARHHESELPAVVAARVGRMWGVFRPLQTIDLNGRDLNAERIGLAASYVLIPLAGFGLFVLRRRGEPILPMLALAVLVVITAALFYGAARFRVPADVAIVVSAAVALDAACSRLWPSAGRCARPRRSP